MNSRILIIDDTRSIHDDFQKILGGNAEKEDLDALEAELFGGPSPASPRPSYELESAYGGESGHALVAAAAAEGRPYAMAFVDMRMPAGWDGLVTIQHLWKVDPELQIVICTAYSDHSWEDLFRALGPTNNLLVLKKPFDEVEVTQMVYTLTTKRSLAEQARARTREVERLVEVRTEQLVHSQKALADTNLRLQSIMDAVPVGLVTMRPDGRIDSANRAAGESFGYTPDEMEGLHLQELISGADLRAAQIPEAEGRRKDGSSFPVNVLLRDVPLDSDLIYTGVISDITERKRAMDDLLLAKARAEAADQAKTDFLARMSHELRTPMSGVLGMAHKLLDASLGPDQQQDVELIVVSAESLLDTINEILDLAKVEAGHMQLESIPFDFKRQVGEVLGLLGPAAATRGLELRADYSPTAPEWFLGDPVRVRQILHNLVGNALKFTRRGGVTVRVTVNEELRVEVADTGVGIPVEKHALIFEKFAQAEVSTTRRYGGTGLGLPICRELVQLMRGEIGLQSEVGRGSTFWFQLPLPAVAAPVAAAEPVELNSLAGARILLAEDNFVNQQVATHFLQRWGCKVDVACTGEEAITMFQEAHYNLVLMDCQMPVVDGFEAARAIRLLKEGALVPMIAFTASTVGDAARRCREAGMDEVLSKPVSPSKLRASLSRWLEPVRVA